MSTSDAKKWLFLIPVIEGECYILYAPLQKLAVYVYEETRLILQAILEGEKVDSPAYAEVMQFLLENRLLEVPDVLKASESVTQSSSYHATLSTTNRCNLRCLYCYARGGVDLTTMTWEIAKAAIEDIFKSAVNCLANTVKIVFHGGGEAFTVYKLLQRCVEYSQELARQYSMEVYFSAVTNATLITQSRALWMKQVGFKGVTVSLDGTETVQNAQRPMVGGKGSFAAALRGIMHLRNAGVTFTVRATVTSMSVSNMPDFVQFLADYVFPDGLGSVQFEIFSFCGRATDTEGLSVNSAEFVTHYLAAKKLALKLGINLICSLDTFKKEKLVYCGGATGNLACYTPEGRITACTRATKSTDAGAELFMYGTLEKTGFAREQSQLEAVRSNGMVPSFCANCYARFNCAGGCPIARYAEPEGQQQTCDVLRQLLVLSLQESLA